MRRTIALLLLLTLVMPVVAAEEAPPVAVTLLNYVPTPAQPGNVIDVYVQVANNDNNAANGVSIQLLPSESFTIEGQDTIKAGTIAAYNVYVAKFKVRISSDAGAGERILQAKVLQTGVPAQSHELTITLTADDAAVFITDVDTTPTNIEPGRDLTLDVQLENLADARLRDVTVELDLTGTPFVPIEGTGKRKVSTLASRASTDITYSLATSPTATAGVYQIPVDISFLDETGSTQTQEDTFGLRINTEANTKAYLDEVNRLNGDSEITIRIVNKGLSEVKFLEATIGEGEGYTVDPADKEIYVGNIDSDDWETVRVLVTTDEQNINIPLTYTYRDAFNTPHTVNANFDVAIPAKTEQGNTGTIIFVVIIIVIVVGCFWWRKRKKKR